MELTFREASYDDLDDIIKLCNECFEENTDLEYAKKIHLENQNDNQIYLVGIMDNKIVAHTLINVIPTIYENMSTYAILNHICVKPEYRRNNIGTKMLDECQKICKKHNCVSMKLWSKNFRIPAHECYKKYGFEIEEAKFFYKEIRSD